MTSPAGESASLTRGEPIIVTGGKVHFRQANADGVTFRVEMQFFKTRHAGQCWNGLGRDSAGNIYLGNSTHADNSYVYKLNPRTGQMRFLGDLLSNLRYGGRGGTDNGKIHSAFIEGPGGDMYFVSHCGSDTNLRYGGHLWKYDIRTDRIVDLGVPMPGNTNFALSEPRDGITYTCSTPAGLFIRCDLNTLEFTAIEATDMNYVRHLPVDAEGNLYVFWGNRIRKFDPKVGHWQVVATNDQTDPDKTFGPTTGFVWTRDRKRLYFPSHVQGNLFCWHVGSPTVEPLGKLHPDRKPVYLHSLHLNPAEDRLFGLGGTGKKDDKGFYVYDIGRRKSYKLFSLDDIIAHELAGLVRSEPFVDFTDCGGITGDDGTMYLGFTGGGADQDLDPDGESIVALTAVRVSESDSNPDASMPRETWSRTAICQSTIDPSAIEILADTTPPATTADLPAIPAESDTVGTGLVVSYRLAARPADRNSEGQFPLTYWVRLRAEPGSPCSRGVLLYVHVGIIDNGPDQFMPGGKINLIPESGTAHDPRFDRYLLEGRRLRYRGRLTPTAGGRPPYVDTTTPGGHVQIVFQAEPVERLADFVIGKTVAFDGAIEPRKLWMDTFGGEDWWQDWQLIVTLAGGETVDIGDRLLVESYDFRRCLALIRDHRAVKVGVVGQVWDAKPLKERAVQLKCSGTPRDIRGDILVAVEELRVLGDVPHREAKL